MNKQEGETNGQKNIYVIKNVTYDNIENAIQDDIDSEEEYQEYEITNDKLGEDVILASGPIYRVIDKNLIFVEGTYFIPDERNPGHMMPDWALTLIYENVPDDEFDINKYLYFEQDGPETTIHNFMMQM